MGVKFFSVPHLSNLKPWKSQAMFQSLTSISFSRAEPLKSRAALQCVQRVNTLIEKCSFSQLMCNVTLAHIYLPREGDERGKHNETKWKKGSRRTKRQMVDEESERGKSSRRGNRFQEAGARETQWWRWMRSDSLGGANQQEREEEWQRHRVIQTKLGCQRKQKEQRQRAAHHPSHGLRSLNIYITQCQTHKEAIRERESGLCTGPDMAGHLWILHKFRKKNKKILAVWGPVSLNALLHDWW